MALFGAMYLMLDEFPKRSKRELSGPAIADRLQTDLQDAIDPDGVVA